MMNTINSGSLDTLKFGQTLVTRAIKVNGGKIQLEVAEIIQQQEENVLQMFNQSDSRFQRGARRAWLTAEPQDAARVLGVAGVADTSKYMTGEDGKVQLTLNILNPVVNGKRLRVQITETVIPTEYEALNIETRAKRKGANGPFILHNGQYIFTKSEVVLHEPQHTFLKADEAVNAAMPQNIDFSTGEILS